MTLTEEAQGTLDRRTELGNEAVDLAGNDERETAASDIISDILTALFGPPGTASYGGSITYNREALDRAQDLLWYAFDSYRGDAEDYWRDEPVPCDTPPGTHVWPERCGRLGQIDG